MTANITDSDTFTDPIVVPVDGEADDQVAFALAPQGLANRTAYLKNIVDAVATYTVTGTVAAGSAFTLTEVLNPESAYTLATNEITVPKAGLYLVSLYGTCQTADATNPSQCGAFASVAGGATFGTDAAGVVGTRFSTSTGDKVNASFCGVVQVDNVSKTIQVKSTGTANITINSGVLQVVRVQ